MVETEDWIHSLAAQKASLLTTAVAGVRCTKKICGVRRWKTQRCCALDLASNNQSETGIKWKCALDELKYFSVVDYVAHHAQHSWGNWTLWCQVGLGTLSGWRACELETLNYRLTHFIYGFPDSAYKLYLDGMNFNGAMRQTADQMWFFLRFLPNTKREQTLGTVAASSVMRGLCFLLLHHSRGHHTWNISLWNTTLYSCPYLQPETQTRSPPLTKSHLEEWSIKTIFWTMRFEARHNFFKQLSHIICNFKNICKTMAFRNQMKLCYCFLTDSIFSTNTELGSGHGSFLAAACKGSRRTSICWGFSLGREVCRFIWFILTVNVQSLQ